MRSISSAIALSFAVATLTAPAAYAQQPAPYRSAAPQTFTGSDLQRYGLSPADATQIAQMQAHGYQVQVISQEQAEQYQAGQYRDNQAMWIVIGAVILVVLVAAAVN